MEKDKFIPSAPMQAAVYIALLVSAYFIGNLTAKIQYLEKSKAVAGATTGEAATQGKYKSFEEAMKALAKAAGANADKLVSCMNAGQKAPVVNTDEGYGSTLGVSGTPAFYINGRFIGGAFPYEAFKEVIDKELAGTATDVVTDYSQSLQDAAGRGSFDPVAKTVDIGTAPVRGEKNAPITIVEFSDFQCPFCGRAFPTMEQILKEYKGKVRLVYKHFPLDIHPRAQKTAEASECARDQGKFWEFHDQLFAQQQDWASL